MFDLFPQTEGYNFKNHTYICVCACVYIYMYIYDASSEWWFIFIVSIVVPLTASFVQVSNVFKHMGNV